MQLFVFMRKVKNMLKMIRGRRWGLLWDRMPFAKVIFTLTNFIPHPQSYKYIILGGHGVGLTAFLHYLESIHAKPCQVLTYEAVRPFIFWRKFNGFSKQSSDGLVFDKAPLNAYAPSIFKSLKYKVPLYQIIRDPISIIKSNINVSMFHAISKINSQEDASNYLFLTIDHIEHLMFHFTSERALVSHIASEVHYLRMRDIDDSGMLHTMQSFASKFGYNLDSQSSDVVGGGGKFTLKSSNNKLPSSYISTQLHISDNTPNYLDSIQESAIKGSLFPRCFPYVFEYNNEIFVLSTPSRLNGQSIQEVDMITLAKRPHIKEYYPIKHYVVQNYEQYPLILASVKSINISSIQQDELNQKIQKYIHYVFEMLKKHKDYEFTEERIIATLLNNQSYAKDLAYKIHRELDILRCDFPNILDEFIHTKKFLSYFNLDKGE